MNVSFLPRILLLASLCAVSSSSWAADWPQWRGADRTDRSAETGLLQSWPAGGPKRVWLSKEGGIGYAGFSVVQGKLFTMGAIDKQEFLMAFEAETGKKLWALPVGETYPNDWGDGPRSTPTVDGDLVYALGAKGGLICAQTADGKLVWQTTMKDLGGKVPGWGYCESVLVDGNQVVCTPGGGKGTVAALDKKTGKLIWQTKDFTDDAHYASIIIGEIHGVRQYIQLTAATVVGLKPADGTVLWRSPWQGKVAVIPTPIYRDGLVYITSGYGVGCKLVKVGPNNEVSDVYQNKVIKNHHGGVILVGDHVYGHSDGAGWTCQDFKTGAEVWSSKAFGKGAVSFADGRLYCLEEGSGTLVLAEASPKKWTEHGRFTLDPQTTLRKPQGRIWTHPVISNGKLYLRDQELIYCYDVKAP
ncbi:MAG: PQQ-like beta-propeller repeat protein [Verrucomicrobiales bacterium]|nr:PQQ-like beta-propeller repeat protein [Verrucomicrobiales bacterium]